MTTSKKVKSGAFAQTLSISLVAAACAGPSESSSEGFLNDQASELMIMEQSVQQVKESANRGDSEAMYLLQSLEDVEKVLVQTLENPDSLRTAGIKAREVWETFTGSTEKILNSLNLSGGC